VDKGRNKRSVKKTSKKGRKYIMKKRLKNKIIIKVKSSFFITGKRERIKG